MPSLEKGWQGFLAGQDSGAHASVGSLHTVGPRGTLYYGPGICTASLISFQLMALTSVQGLASLHGLSIISSVYECPHAMVLSLICHQKKLHMPEIWLCSHCWLHTRPLLWPLGATPHSASFHVWLCALIPPSCNPLHNSHSASELVSAALVLQSLS